MKGGKREGAGRPKGTTKGEKINYHRRIKPEWVNILDNVLKSLRRNENDNKNVE